MNQVTQGHLKNTLGKEQSAERKNRCQSVCAQSSGNSQPPDQRHSVCPNTREAALTTLIRQLDCCRGCWCRQLTMDPPSVPRIGRWSLRWEQGQTRTALSKQVSRAEPRSVWGRPEQLCLSRAEPRSVSTHLCLWSYGKSNPI